MKISAEIYNWIVGNTNKYKMTLMLIFSFFLLDLEKSICQDLANLYLNSGSSIHQYPGGNKTALDSDGNIFYCKVSKNDFSSGDTIYLIKCNKFGELQWSKKFFGSPALDGAITSLTIYRNYLYGSISFRGRIFIEDSVYNTPPDSIGLSYNYGCIPVKFDLNGNIVKHKFLAVGRALKVYNISSIKANEIIAVSNFSGLIDFIHPVNRRIYLRNNNSNNLVLLQLDSNFNVLNYKNSNVNGSAGNGSFGDLLKNSNLVFGNFSSLNGDSLRFSNVKIDSDMDECPIVIYLDSSLNVFQVVKGKKNVQNQQFVSGAVTYAGEDNEGNLYCLLLNFGAYEFANFSIGKENDISQSVVKLNSQGNGVWQKTFTTGGFQQFGGGLYFDKTKNKFWLRGVIQDTFSIGNYNFMEGEFADHRLFIAVMDTDSQIETVKYVGFNSDASIIDCYSGIDSSGNFIALLESNFPDAFRAGCFDAEAIRPFPPNDTVRQFWVKIGPCSLKKDSLFTSFSACADQNQIRAHYSSIYGPLEYKWSTGDTGSIFSPTLPGMYRLIVNDSTCCADTQYFQVPTRPNIPQPQIVGIGSAGTGQEFWYVVSVPDSLVLQWSVTGGQIVAGQGSDSLLVFWPQSVQGSVVVSVSDSLGQCSKSDTLQVLVTSLAQMNFDSAWQLAPNPAKTKVQIKGNETRGTTHWWLQSLQGKSMLQGIEFSSNFEVNLTGLPKGIYLLQLQSEQGNWTKKVMKE